VSRHTDAGRREIGKITKALAIVSFAVALTACAPPAGVPTSPAAATRHPSGLLVVSPDDNEIQGQAVPDGLGDAYGAYNELSHIFPDDLGYANVINGEVVIDVATDEGMAIVESFKAGVAMHPDYDTEGKMAGSLAEHQTKIVGVQIATRRVEYSRTSSMKLVDEVMDLGKEFKSAGIFMGGVHERTGRIIVHMAKLSDDLAAAIVDRYGTEKVVVVLEPGVTVDFGVG